MPAPGMLAGERRVCVEMEALRRSEELAPDDAYALGMSLYRLQRLAIGEPDVQEAFLYKR